MFYGRRLQFSTELLNLDREVGDHVIVHELLHFSAPNHGKLWKSLMRAHLGDYARLEGRLTRADNPRDESIPASLIPVPLLSDANTGT